MSPFKKSLMAMALASGMFLAGCSGQQQTQSGQAGSTEAPKSAETAKAPENNAGPMKKVYIATIVDHPALNDVREGVIEELAEKGYKQNENLVLKISSAQGNTSIAGQIAKQFAAENPDAVVAIATPMAQAMVTASSTVPIVYSAITDPIAAKLVKSWEPSGTNVTGVSDMLPLDQQIDLMKEMIPGLKDVGYVYSPGEVNSTIVLQELEEKMKPMGIKIHAVAAPRTTDIPSAAKSLAGKVQLIYTSLDNNVVSAYESLFQAGKEMKVPLLAADTGSVTRGAIMALGVNYRQIGRKTGDVVLEILNGKKPGDIPSQTLQKLDLYINTANAKALGYEIPQSLLDKADFIDGVEVKKGGAEAASEAAPAPAPEAQAEGEAKAEGEAAK